MTDYVGKHRAEEDPWEELDQPINVLPTLKPFRDEPIVEGDTEGKFGTKPIWPE